MSNKKGTSQGASKPKPSPTQDTTTAERPKPPPRDDRHTAEASGPGDDRHTVEASDPAPPEPTDVGEVAKPIAGKAGKAPSEGSPATASTSSLNRALSVVGLIGGIITILGMLATLLPGALSNSFAAKKDTDDHFTKLDASDKELTKETAALAASVEGLDRRLRLAEAQITKAGLDMVHNPKLLDVKEREEIDQCCKVLEQGGTVTIDPPAVFDAYETAAKMCRFRLARSQPKASIFFAVTRTLAVVDRDTPDECIANPGIGPPDPGPVTKAPFRGQLHGLPDDLGPGINPDWIAPADPSTTPSGSASAKPKKP